MSKQDALKAINMEWMDHVPHWEMISHPDFERSVSGIDPYEHPQQARLKMIEVLDLAIDSAPDDDRTISIKDDKQTGRATTDRVRWGTGNTWSWNHRQLRTLEEMWSFDPMEVIWKGKKVETYEDIDEIQPFFGQNAHELSRSMNGLYQQKREVLGDRCLPVIGFYRTLVMWVLMLCDWDLFLQAVALYPERLGELFDRFGELNLRIFEALASTDAPLVYSHDDICMTSGAICNPEFYRRYVYPWYERLWSVLHSGGRKVIFISDGNIDPIVDDIFACGADGIYAEPYTNLEAIARRYGGKKILWGNADNRVLMAGDHKSIRAEVERCIRLAWDCPGYFLGVTNHITWDLPVDSVRFYFDYSRQVGRR